MNLLEEVEEVFELLYLYNEKWCLISSVFSFFVFKAGFLVCFLFILFEILSSRLIMLNS